MSDEDDEIELTFAAMMSAGIDQIEDEMSNFEGDPPKHGARLLANRSTDLLGTLTNIDVETAHEEMDDPTDEEVASALEEDINEILLAIAAVKWEYDLDIESAFRDRIDFMEAYRDADSMEELIEEIHGEEAVEEMVGGVKPGDNVDADGYDGGDDRSYA